MLSLACKDPLIRFLLGGFLIFGLYSYSASQADSYKINITRGMIDSLEATWQKEHGRPPNETSLKALIDHEIRTQILSREAIRLGLDRNDRVISRRLVQKIEFMLDDAVADNSPSDTSLRAYFEAHKNLYQSAQRIDFKHLFFSEAERVDPQGDASLALSQLKLDDDAPKSDLFFGKDSYLNQDQTDLRKVFGPGFFKALSDLEVGSWQPAIRSVYGWHLIHIDKLSAQRNLSFESAFDQIRYDWRTDESKRLKQMRLKNLAAAYEVKILGKPHASIVL